YRSLMQTLETTLQDLRYSCRVLSKSPGFVCVVVISLALGIGANTAIFTLINAVLLRTLPVEKPEQIVLFARSRNATDYGFMYREYVSFRENSEFFSGLAAYSPVRLSATVNGS